MHSVAQTVEWLYAFDVHCNGFFVSFLFTHVLQFLLLPLLLRDTLAAAVCSACLWAAALASYCFVVHLGYRALPFLKHTERYLYPVAAVGIGWVVLVLLALAGYRVNLTRVTSATQHAACALFVSFCAYSPLIVLCCLCVSCMQVMVSFYFGN